MSDFKFKCFHADACLVYLYINIYMYYVSVIRHSYESHQYYRFRLASRGVYQ
jgi:hypothetical protein